MKFKKNLLIFSGWLLILAGYVTYKLKNPSILCWDGVDEDPVTGELIKVGGCEPEYDIALQMLILPITIWVGILITLLILKHYYVRQKTR
ncbi:hypothetical protein HN748_03475 [Candidatus Peregrinibacteria bacterium]|jgi:hypothetical protein|nr:hypothetical protein [Candidatus Peregrinibacteria bacterium]MBT7483362.1 hypothetical protein [Candidatus Peregrinibacteria bacterium]MBT7703269.1 hypothetical protein [Candidatus Peregrinibacteria bacterium]